jgi:glycosyltransferase involved in cell wall biosynthesis
MSVLISLFTPTHDSSHLLEAYESIKGQDFFEWVIVLNNGAAPVLISDLRVKQIRLDETEWAAFIDAPSIYKEFGKGMYVDWLTDTYSWVGPLKAYACSKCSGDVLFELDHDDLLTSDALAETAAAFEDPEIGFVYSNTIHTYGSNFDKVARFDERYGWCYREVEYDGHKLDEHLAFDPNPDSISRIWFAPNHLRAFRRLIYEEVGGYAKNMRVLDDLDLMCRLYLKTKFKHIDKGLYVYCYHLKEDGTLSNTFARPDLNPEIQNNVYRVHDRYFDDMVGKFADNANLPKVELGGRMVAKEGYRTVDLCNADLIANLDERWPFEDNSVGVFRAFDVFEHLKSPIHTMQELYRCLVPGGYAVVQVPSTDGRGAFQDPTHVSFWNANSFRYYTDRRYSKYLPKGTNIRFQALHVYDTEPNEDRVIWTVAHLVKLGLDYRYSGPIDI